MAQQRILGPRDYFSDRTFGDIAVQGMQIKGMRGRIEEDEARRGAYAKAYGGDPSADRPSTASHGVEPRSRESLFADRGGDHAKDHSEFRCGGADSAVPHVLVS